MPAFSVFHGPFSNIIRIILPSSLVPGEPIDLTTLMAIDPERTAHSLETMERLQLIGKLVKLSDGRGGPIVHVEYEAPRRVALVKTFPETPSPLTRVGVDRLSPPHLPYIVEIQVEPQGSKEG